MKWVLLFRLLHHFSSVEQESAPQRNGVSTNSFWGPHNKDCRIFGSALGSPFFGETNKDHLDIGPILNPVSKCDIPFDGVCVCVSTWLRKQR